MNLFESLIHAALLFAFGMGALVSGVAAFASAAQGIMWLASDPENVMQQQAGAELATAYFVLAGLLWWLATQFFKAAEKHNQ